MVSPCNTNTNTNLESIHLLFQKPHAIFTVNQKNLDNIKSRKGQQLVTKHQYSIQTQPSAAKKQRTQHYASISTATSNASDVTNDTFTLLDHKSTKNVDDIISSWRHSGAALLTKEKNLHR